MRSPWGVFYLVTIAAPRLSRRTLTTVISMTEVNLDVHFSLSLSLSPCVRVFVVFILLLYYYFFLMGVVYNV